MRKFNLQEKIQKFLKNRDGHVAVTTAIIGLPLLMVSGYAVDYNKALSGRSEIASAIDTAALAAVLPATLSESERKAYAQNVFDQNYFGNLDVKLDIKAKATRVEIAATGQSPTLFGGIIGMDTMGVKDKTAAVKTTSDVVCVLALDPEGERAIEFKNNTKFNAPACSVQANSTGHVAIDSQSLYPPVAKSFCTTGVSRGKFVPNIKHECAPIADPYANLPIPEDGPCISVSRMRGLNDIAPLVGQLTDTIGANAVLVPGTYCKGLTIDGLNVTFLPGTYIFKDKELRIRKMAEVKGEDVTIVFKGKKASLNIESGAKVKLKAPSRGVYAGIAFFQPIKTFDKKNTKLPIGSNTIGSGGGLEITGTAYFPGHKLDITSDSHVVSQAPATSFIAYQISFSGDSAVTVHVDHERGGVPPLQPRSDEGARLIR